MLRSAVHARVRQRWLVTDEPLVNSGQAVSQPALLAQHATTAPDFRPTVIKPSNQGRSYRRSWKPWNAA